MSEVLDLQIYSLLARLHEDRDAACRKLRETEAGQSAQLLAQARVRARARVKGAVLERQRKVDEHCRRVRVRLETRRREESFARFGKRLSDGLAMLPDALAARWGERDSRSRWCQMVLEGAAAALRKGSWQIQVAAGLSAGQRSQLAQRATELAAHVVEIEEIESLRAGMAVLHGGVRFDGTISGLLSDDMRVKAALLAELGAGGHPG